MEKQIDVRLLPPSDGGTFRRVQWLICDNGMSVASGTVRCRQSGQVCDWEEERPPAEYEGQVRLAIARALAAS